MKLNKTIGLVDDVYENFISINPLVIGIVNHILYVCLVCACEFTKKYRFIDFLSFFFPLVKLLGKKLAQSSRVVYYST